MVMDRMINGVSVSNNHVYINTCHSQLMWVMLVNVMVFLLLVMSLLIIVIVMFVIVMSVLD